jgi:hypothetical protein
MKEQKILERFANLYPAYFKPKPALGEGIYLIPTPNEYFRSCFNTNYNQLEWMEKRFILELIHKYGCRGLSFNEKYEKENFDKIESFVKKREEEMRNQSALFFEGGEEVRWLGDYPPPTLDKE